jgi:UDP-glucuronate decarboxylase
MNVRPKQTETWNSQEGRWSRYTDKSEGDWMRVLVTGGAGFIGSHLTAKLIQKGHNVTVMDNLYTGKVENIPSGANFYEGNVIYSRPPGDYDWIFNLACPASPRWYQENPLNTSLTNVKGAMNMLEIALSSGARILQASTSEVYGDPLVSPQHEDYWGNVNPIGLRACYDEGKRMAETLCYDYSRQYGVDIRVARIFNTYGPRMSINDGRVVSNFIVQALRDEPITVYGDGSQTRSLCYVDDTVDGLIALMQSDEKRPVNIGNNHEITMIQLAAKIATRTRSQSKIVFDDLPQDDPQRRKPDLKRAMESLNWSPSVWLDDGLDMTIQYFKGII